jgi:ubiquinone biosynthesis protein
VALTAILKYSTKRGIQTSPLVSLIGKAFANLEGSVRYIAPELSITDTLEDELKDVMFEMARESMSQESMAKNAVEGMIAAASMPEQIRGVMRDLANRELTLQNNSLQGPRSRQEDRADKRAAAMRRTMVAIAAGAAYWDYRRRRP